MRYGYSEGFAAARDAYKREKRHQEDKADRATERDARKDQIETNKVINEQTRRVAPGKGDADLASNRARAATAREQEKSSGIRGRADRSNASTQIAQNDSANRRLASDEESAISNNRANTAQNREREATASSAGIADRAENTNRANEAQGRDRTLRGRTNATNAESSNRAAEARRKNNTVGIELSALKDSLARDSGNLEAEEQTKFAESMNGFLQGVYETAKRNGPRGADLLNDFDLNNDGKPDITGAADIVFDNGEMRVVDAQGQPVIDGSTGEPAVYNEEEFKKVLEGKTKTSRSKSSTGGSSTKKTDNSKYSTKVRDAVNDSVRARLGIDSDDTRANPKAQSEIDLISGAVDKAMASEGLSINEAMDKYGSPDKILRSTGFTRAQLEYAAKESGLSEEEVLRQAISRK